ncbi:hypothetical protein [Nannocystis punicea]|uniref:Uncharacterized protein n=1 Tax=Nannocystis punicea TaxID=2995304 RepID=A0ABY7HHE5_9BACT|nr:hypothetical protein [Nannocystis poenicansa]WAS98722.1 hypothetical protein O0S08_21520 [Nannocystis poenicansa]
MILQIAALEQENERLRRELAEADARARGVADDTRERRRSGAHKTCVMCGGVTLLPVAIFAGHDTRAPLPLHMSTLRFTSPSGGFTHSAPVHSLVCSTCGFLHNFIDMADRSGGG